jgi:ABC-2 type transport system permease protein
VIRTPQPARPQATRTRPAGAALPPRRIGPVNWLGIATIIRRELGTYRRQWLESIAAPTLMVFLYLAVFIMALGDPDDATVHFMLPGLVLFTMLTRAAETTCFGIAFLRIERRTADLVTPPTSAVEIVAAYVAAGAMTGIVTGLPCLALVLLLFGHALADPLLAAGFALLTVATTAAAGSVVGLLSEKWDQASAFFGFLLLPVTLISGLFMPVDLLPEPLLSIARFNPIFYALDGFRAAFGGHGVVPVWHGLLVTAGTGALFATAAAAILSTGWRVKP